MTSTVATGFWGFTEDAIADQGFKPKFLQLDSPPSWHHDKRGHRDVKVKIKINSGEGLRARNNSERSLDRRRSHTSGRGLAAGEFFIDAR